MNKKKMNFALTVGLFITAVFVLTAIISMFYTPYDAYEMSYTEKFMKPSMEHLFGTDNFGRDIFSRVMLAVKNSILIAGSAILISFIIGTIVGSVTGYYGGIIDEILMRINDALAAIPSILLAMVLVAVMDKSVGTMIVALTIAFIPSFARVARSQVINLKNRDYVSSAKLSGASDFRIIVRHILPNGRSAIVTGLTVGFNNAILAEAGLSFLGIGIQPPAPSIGSMLSEAQGYFVAAPHYVIFPAVVMIFLVIGIVMIGEGYGKN